MLPNDNLAIASVDALPPIRPRHISHSELDYQQPEAVRSRILYTMMHDTRHLRDLVTCKMTL